MLLRRELLEGIWGIVLGEGRRNEGEFDTCFNEGEFWKARFVDEDIITSVEFLIYANKRTGEKWKQNTKKNGIYAIKKKERVVDLDLILWVY